MIKAKNRFYVYALLDPRKPGKYVYGNLKFKYEPFYIGKGCGYRMWQHTSDVMIKRNRNPHLCRKIKKLKQLSLQPVYVKIYENLTEQKSLLIEKKIIKLIGRRNQGGILTNIDEGGRVGPEMTTEMKNKISKTKIKYYKHHKHPFTGRHHTAETKLKISKNHSDCWNGKKHTMEDKNKIGKANRGRRITKTCNSYIFISPSGSEIIVKDGLKYFCKQHHLCRSSVSKMIRGTRKISCGWKFKQRVKTNNVGKCLSYCVIDPQNKKYIIKDGLRKFCCKHNLQYVDLIKVAKNQRSHHKHWKCEYCNK